MGAAADFSDINVAGALLHGEAHAAFRDSGYQGVRKRAVLAPLPARLRALQRGASALIVENALAAGFQATAAAQVRQEASMDQTLYCDQDGARNTGQDQRDVAPLHRIFWHASRIEYHTGRLQLRPRGVVHNAAFTRFSLQQPVQCGFAHIGTLRIVAAMTIVVSLMVAGYVGRSPWIVVLATPALTLLYALGKFRQWQIAWRAGGSKSIGLGVLATLPVQLGLGYFFYLIGRGLASLIAPAPIVAFATGDVVGNSPTVAVIDALTRGRLVGH